MPQKKGTYTYNPLQFPAEMNTSGSKTPITFLCTQIMIMGQIVD